MSIEVKNLTKIYGVQRAVDEVSFTAKKGEILGFLGPNGAGKTTTMKMITGYIPPSAGQALVCGYDVERSPLEVRRRIGYLPEHNPVYRDMYVKEYLAFISGLHGLRRARARVDELIQMTGLERERHKLIGALSKGYRQRVGLAQAMIHDPEALILDEPTSGLDPNQLVEIRRLIKSLGQEKTLIFSTHIMQEVQALCDRVIIINRGKIVADDPIDALTSRLAGESVLTVEFAEDAPAEALRRIEGVRKVQALSPQRWQIVAGREKDLRPAVFQFAVARGLTLLEMRQETYSVEEVFQELTRESAHA
jgi:ABC-2 type transport system ATP-binding protein